MLADDTSDVDVILPIPKGSISFSVFDSDHIANGIVMEQVVGTLVRYSGVGRYEPYLAKTWHCGPDQKTWTFEFNTGLLTEDGIIINAVNYEINLKKLLKIYAKTYSPPAFNKLEGWQDFIEGEDHSLGIRALSENILEMKFTEVPSGLFEFLSMPYFGFYSPHDFDGDRWRNSKHIFSSGVYRVVSYIEDAIILEERVGWTFLKDKQDGVRRATIRFSSLDEIANEDKNFIIQLQSTDDFIPEGFVRINTTPTLLEGIVISPFIPPFDSLAVRKAFRTILRNKLEQKIMTKQNEIKSNCFYPCFSHFSIDYGEYAHSLKLLKGIEVTELSVFHMKHSSKMSDRFTFEVLGEVLKELNWGFFVDDLETLGTDWIKKGLDSHSYAIRTVGVDIGSSPENWVVDMMFCSMLGIRFPDTNNRIKEIVERFKSGAYPQTEDYWKAIHNAIEETSSVIPISHSGFSWLFSSRVDYQEMPASFKIPRLDQVKVRVKKE